MFVCLFFSNYVDKKKGQLNPNNNKKGAPLKKKR